MTTYIYADNFRGFSDAIVPIYQVNFLVGENSTGKTSFIELIETLGNMPFWVFEPRYGALGLPQKHFLDLVSAAGSSKKAFSIGAIGMDNEQQRIDVGMIVTYKSWEGRPVPSRVSMIEGDQVRSIDGQLWMSGKGEKFKSRARNCTKEFEHLSCIDKLQFIVATHKKSSGFEEREVPEERVGAPLFFRYHEALFGGKGLDDRAARAPHLFMTRFIDLAPIRTKPRRTYDAPQTEFSPEGEHTAYVIRKQLASKTQAEAFQTYLERAGESSGLFKSVSVKQYGTQPLAPFELKIILGHTSFGLENVGYGVSQALPVLVEMFVRPNGTAFTVQQPEVHLHPKAQATFGDLIAGLSRTDKKIFFVETHSDFAIDRFRLNVRKEGYVPSQLLFFERDELGNHITSIPIDENGDLPEDQPETYRAFFFNESLALLS